MRGQSLQCCTKSCGYSSSAYVNCRVFWGASLQRKRVDAHFQRMQTACIYAWATPNEMEKERRLHFCSLQLQLHLLLHTVGCNSSKRYAKMHSLNVRSSQQCQRFTSRKSLMLYHTWKNVWLLSPRRIKSRMCVCVLKFAIIMRVHNPQKAHATLFLFLYDLCQMAEKWYRW